MIKVSQKTKFDLKNEKKDRYILVCHIFFSTMSAQRSTYLPSFVCSKPIYGSCPRWNKIQAYQQRSPTNRQSTTYSLSPNRIRYLLNLCLQPSLFRTFHIHTHCRSGKHSTNLDRSDPLTQLHGSRIIGNSFMSFSMHKIRHNTQPEGPIIQHCRGAVLKQPEGQGI